MHVESVLLFESTEEIYARVFRALKPRTSVPVISTEFCKFANANSFIRLREGHIQVRISDVFAAAPAPIMEALAYILLSKLYRKPVPGTFNHRYRLYLNRKDVRQLLQATRKERGRKLVSAAQGEAYDLQAIFESLNLRYFSGLMACPELGWSRRKSRTTLGHYDPSHHAIVISKLLDSAEVPKLAVEYVMYHEMLHLRYPVDHRGVRRCVHTPEFKAAENQFADIRQARELLKHLL